MKRELITEGQELVVQPSLYRSGGWDRVTVVSRGGLFVRVAAVVNGEDRTGLFHPSELEPAPDASPGTKENPILCDFAKVKTVTGRITLAANIHSLENIARKHKWNTPGRHTITSYRSFRRYKAAGASFGVIPFNSSNRQPEKELVNISVSMARRRAQAGLSLVAVVSA